MEIAKENLREIKRHVRKLEEKLRFLKSILIFLRKIRTENDKSQETLISLVSEILSEGNAADSLIKTKLGDHPSNHGRDIAYSKISDTDLSTVLPEQFGTFPDAEDQSYIGKLLHHWKRAN